MNYNYKTHFVSTSEEFPMRTWCQKQLIGAFDEEMCDQPNAGA